MDTAMQVASLVRLDNQTPASFHSSLVIFVCEAVGSGCDPLPDQPEDRRRTARRPLSDRLPVGSVRSSAGATHSRPIPARSPRRRATRPTARPARAAPDAPAPGRLREPRGSAPTTRSSTVTSAPCVISSIAWPATASPMTTITQEILVPAMHRIGTDWHDGVVTIADEHRASAIVERILGDHYPTPRGRRRGTVVVVALSGERHALPTSMAALALREDNWHVQHLGADLPAEELIHFCRERPVDLVVLTTTTNTTRPAAARLRQTAYANSACAALVGNPVTPSPTSNDALGTLWIASSFVGQLVGVARLSRQVNAFRRSMRAVLGWPRGGRLGWAHAFRQRRREGR